MLIISYLESQRIQEICSEIKFRTSGRQLLAKFGEFGLIFKRSLTN